MEADLLARWINASNRVETVGRRADDRVESAFDRVKAHNGEAQFE